MKGKTVDSRYPRINIRIPADLFMLLKKLFCKRGELSKALVYIIKGAVHDNDKINRVKSALSEDQKGIDKRS